jgi:hypothetical protein
MLHIMHSLALLKNVKRDLSKIVYCLYPITSAVQGEKSPLNVPQMNGIYLARKRKIKINNINSGY